MLIEYGRHKVRNAESEDADVLAGWWNDGEVMEHAGFPEGLGTDPETVRKELSLDSDEARRRLIIEMDGVSAGKMSYRNKGGGVAEIGIKYAIPPKGEEGMEPS
jgi:RimJ/RimL family protein N-acetyltransferase